MSRESAGFRHDIQALRGLAILLVLLYHTEIGLFQAGFLGVDIFFVISGYLITGIVRRQIEEGSFSFTGFYARRAKRLLPAAYITFLVTTIAAGFLLTSSELLDYQKQLLGALTFTGNIAVWLQTGYFEGAADYKPLLHIWSLAIEEQYYMVLPAAMFLIPRRFWLSGAILVLFASLALCLALSYYKPAATFYLLPTRGWELAVGSLGALTSGKTLARLPLGKLFWPAAIVLAIVPLMPTHMLNGWLDVLVVCIATLVVILGRRDFAAGNPVVRMMSGLGNISYSLYLAHWPVFAFANNIYVSEPGLQARLFLLLLSMGLGWLLYRFVEQPMRYAPYLFNWKTSLSYATASLVLVIGALVSSSFNLQEKDYVLARRGNVGFDPACEFETKFEPVVQCRNSSEPRILVWGDSMAMHLISGLASTAESGVVQATKSFCGPLVGLAPFDLEAHPRGWAEGCLEFNRSVKAYLASTPSIRVVFLASLFEQYLDVADSNGKYWSLKEEHDGRRVSVERSSADALSAMLDTIRDVRQTGKKVVVFAPPPMSGFDIGRCLERRDTGRQTLGADSRDCSIPLQAYHQRKKAVLDFLEILKKESGVEIVRFDALLCGSTKCNTVLDGTFLYRDARHFSYEGSTLVFEKMNIRGYLAEVSK